MALGAAKYRRMMGELDKIGITVCILRIGYKRYQFIIDYEVRKEYMQRRSCNNRLVQLYNSHIEQIQANGNN